LSAKLPAMKLKQSAAASNAMFRLTSSGARRHASKAAAAAASVPTMIAPASKR
jgi:hypothetical protein